LKDEISFGTFKNRFKLDFKHTLQNLLPFFHLGGILSIYIKPNTSSIIIIKKRPHRPLIFVQAVSLWPKVTYHRKKKDNFPLTGITQEKIDDLVIAGFFVR